MKRFFRTSLMSVALCAAFAGAAQADTLYPQLNSSIPANMLTGVAVEQGKKGLLYHFGCFDAGSNPVNTCWPVVTGGSVTLTVPAPGPGQLTCAHTASPAPNACGYVIGNFLGTGNADTIKVYYNTLFPVTLNNITVNVDGATGSGGSTEAACTPATCLLTFASGNNTPRQNTSTELVFDISGSMASPAVPAGSTSRIDALKSAAQSFFAAWQQKAMLGDKLGDVFFSTTAAAFPAAVPNLVAGQDAAQTNTLLAQINAQVPTASTAIGAGLQLANTNGFAADPAPNPRKYVLLFTDGEQNIPAPNGNVTVAGTQVQIGGAAYGPGINVCPITAGNLTAPGFALQQNIANASCNHQNAYIQGTNQTFVLADLQTYFTQLVATMLQGDKYEISKDVQGHLKTAPEVTFLGNGLDLSTTILIHHHPRLQTLRFRLYAPDGTEVNVDGRTRQFNGGSVTEIAYPLFVGKKKISPQGSWKIVFAPELLATADFPDDYHVIVMVDNPKIATTFQPLTSDAGTGDPLSVRATLRDGASKLLNAVVTAEVSGPNVGMGNALSKYNGQGTAPSLGADTPNSAGLRKLSALYNDPSQAKLFGLSGLPMIALKDMALSGVYNGALNKAAVEGHYFFTFHARGKSAGNGEFERTWKTTVFVRPKPDAVKTSVRVLAVGTNNGIISATLRVTPQDKYGNLLGPGYDNAIVFREACAPPNASVRETEHGKPCLIKDYRFAADGLDGSYTYRVQLYPADHGKLALLVLGKAVKTIDLTGAAVGKAL
jgi:hypothetical protein